MGTNHHKSQWRSGGYRSAAQVKRLYKNYVALGNSLSQKDSTFVQGIISELESLETDLQTQERRFYEMIGIKSGADLQEGLRQFQSKADSWNASGASKLLETRTAGDLLNLITAKVDEQELIKSLNQFVNSSQFGKDYLADEDVELSISNLLNGAFSELDPNRKTFSSHKTRGVGASLEASKEGGRIVIRSKGGSPPLSTSMKKRIADELGDVQVNYFTWDHDNPADEDIFLQIKQTILSGISETAKSYIEDELIERFSQYSRVPEFFNVRGFLGEVYWNACLNYLCGERKATIPTGIKRYVSSGKEIAVDIFLRGCGFQVKNWSLQGASKSERTISAQRYFGDFLDSRAAILKTEVGRVIAQVFGALSFNKPNPEWQDRPGYEDYKSFYNSDLSSIADDRGLTDLSDRLQFTLAKILGVNRDELIKGGIAADGITYDTLQNTFWIIGSHIIPSSLIIQQLIVQLRRIEHELAAIAKLEITSMQENKNASVFWPDIPDNRSNLVMANRWTINYDVHFSLEDLITKVINRQK